MIFDRKNKKTPRVFFTGDFIGFFYSLLRRYRRKYMRCFVYFKLDYIMNSNRHDITEILLKVALNTFKQTNESCLWEDHLTKHCDLCHWFKTFKKLIFECIECSNDTGKSKQYQYTFTIHLLKWNNISIKKVNCV